MSSSESTGSDPLAVGDRILDRYVVTHRLESGGTSVVYRANDERLSRPVCVKVFHTIRHKEGIYRTSYEHFIQEAFALSKLTHPNTLRIYDFGHLPGTAAGDGPPFQVSEFMNGGTLSSLIRSEGPLSYPEAVRIVQALAGALGEAHEIGIVHRDIKPKNILFGTSGQGRVPKLADFGIAKALEVAQSQLRHRAGDTQIVAGRRLLMFSGLWAAPEQLAAESVSRQSDIYSLGLVTIYMITGQCVFSSNDATEAYQQRSHSDALIDAAFSGRDISDEVIRLIKEACSFNASLRPDSMSVFARRFSEAFLAPRRTLTLPGRPPVVSPSGAPGGKTPQTGEQAALGPPSTEPLPALPTATGPTRSRIEGMGSTEQTIDPPLRPVPDPESGPSIEPHVPPQRLSISDAPQRVGDRAAQFAPAEHGAADLIVGRGRARIRVSFVPTGPGFAAHIKGLNCFVRRVNHGPPTGAVELRREDSIELVAANRQVLAGARLLFGSPAAGHTVFSVGDRLIAIDVEECPRVISLDFGPNAECVFVYEPNRRRARSGSLWGRSRAQ